MATHWRDLLDLACEIAEGMQGEAAKRASASRAYYAAYHCAKEYLGVCEYIRHQDLVERLLSAQSDRLANAGRMLQQAKWRRVKADYRLEQLFTDEDLRACIQDAKQVTNMLGE